jgi:hypothetical protein
MNVKNEDKFSPVYRKYLNEIRFLPVYQPFFVDEICSDSKKSCYTQKRAVKSQSIFITIFDSFFRAYQM